MYIYIFLLGNEILTISILWYFDNSEQLYGYNTTIILGNRYCIKFTYNRG